MMRTLIQFKHVDSRGVNVVVAVLLCAAVVLAATVIGTRPAYAQASASTPTSTPTSTPVPSMERFALPAPAELHARLLRLKPTAIDITGSVAIMAAVPQSGKPFRAEPLWQRIATDDADRANAFAFAAWRLLPLRTSDRSLFDQHVNAIAKGDARHEWLPVFRLIQAMLDDDRQALLKAAAMQRGVTTFPSVYGEAAQMQAFAAVGVDNVSAGMHVLQHRTFAPLYTLVDLDRHLARQGAYLRSVALDNDADKLFAARDLLRKAWLDASKHVVEKLFALNLLGRSPERQALLAQYENYTKEVQSVAFTTQQLRGMDDQGLWSLLVEPALKSDLDALKETDNLVRALQNRPASRLRIAAESKQTSGSTTTYSGQVKITIGQVTMQCSRAVVKKRDRDDGQTSVRIAADNAKIEAPWGTAVGDRLAFDARGAQLTLNGGVSIKHGSWSAERHYTSAVLSINGNVHRAHSLIDDFETAKDITEKLALLPRIVKVHADDALPDEAKFLRALQLIEPHLTWHAPHSLPKRDGKTIERAEQIKALDDSDIDSTSAWQEALGPEPWMTVPDSVQQATLEQMRDATRDRNPADAARLRHEALQRIHWRIKDAAHADVTRAMQLLEQIKDQKLRRKARRWTAEIQRNNTVVTFDVPGGLPKGKTGGVVLDVRGADRVSFAVYRVRSVTDLQSVHQHIGEHFICRDYALADEHRRLRDVERMKIMEERLIDEKRINRFRLPEFEDKDQTHAWNADVADLPWIEAAVNGAHEWYAEEWSDSGDASYFNDRNVQHRQRLRKSYRPRSRNMVSTWRADRLVKIPAAALPDAGAYILVVEANGQRAYAPLLVEPMSMTLRRARDGVMAVMSDESGHRPVVGAKLHAVNGDATAITNRDGVAFLRVFASGDNAIIAEKDGRYAIGGFGRVFEGIYRSVIEERRHQRMLIQRERISRGRIDAGYLYADRFIVAAYAARPTYRPGQNIQFKMIVRQLKSTENGKRDEGRFRDNDFDVESQLELPTINERTRWALINPRGREVLTGDGQLSAFGTLAGEGQLNNEAETGCYAIRVNIDGMDRIVPDVLQVKNYRRPNFKVTVDGFPDTLNGADKLMLNVAGRYYFGEPVVGGTVDVRLVRMNHWAPLAQVEGQLGETGLAALSVTLPDVLDDGEYAVITTLSDRSGRSVSHAQAITRSMKAKLNATTTPLPRFIKVGESIHVKTSATHLTVQGLSKDAGEERPIDARDGAINLTFDQPGWHEVNVAQQKSLVFVYGDKDITDWRLPQKMREAHADLTWVNLTDFAEQEMTGEDLLSSNYLDVHALFDRHHAKVGETVRLLVHTSLLKPRLLFTLEGRSVVDYEMVEPSDQDSPFRVIELTMRSRMTPNIYIQARVLSGEFNGESQEATERERHVTQELTKLDDGDESVDPRWCRIDVIDPNQKVNGQRLNIAVKTNKQNYQPCDEVSVNLSVTGEDGKPREAEVSLAAVDESIYAFGEDSLDHLPAMFGQALVQRRFQPKAWRSSIGAKWKDVDLARVMDLQKVQQEALSMHLKEMKRLEQWKRDVASSLVSRRGVPLPLLRGAMPVGRVPLARLRSDFRETAAWLPQLQTDENGQASATFKLPDSLTAWRLNAVGVSKGIAIGVGRSDLRTNLPLSVQVFMPRFAVEKDRQQIVALIHNNTRERRTVKVRWEITGGVLIAPLPDGAVVEEDKAKDVTVVTTSIAAGSDGATRATLHVEYDKAETVRMRCQIVDAADKSMADAEQRVIVVRTLGRPDSHAFADSFKGEKRLKLPDGFVLEDLRITASRDSLSLALEGLDYLATYPHGCVEQTMSRFLPLVLLRHASGQAVIELAEKTKAELPAMLSKGLARLYNFQHQDGSWGWFREQSPDDAMTTYVVYGLLRCKQASIEVDAQVLRRGVAFLAKRCRDGSISAEIGARAIYVLALADQLDNTLLMARVKKALAHTSNNTTGTQRCNLALACRAVGLHEHASQLWKQAYLWQPKTTADLSLKLRCMVAFGASLEDCHDAGQRVLANRQGRRWYHTRDTSWAIEALSEMMQFAPVFAKEQNLTVRVNDKQVHTGRFETGRSSPQRVHLDQSNFGGSTGGMIVLQSDGDDPVHYSITARGTQRLDQSKPVGRLLTLQRRYTTLDGLPIKQPVRQGDVIAVRLIIESAVAQSYVLIEDFRPSGFEFADEQWRGPASKDIVHTNFRDDRVSAFVRELKPGQHELVYYLRAETIGLSQILPGHVYPMYNERRRGETGADRLVVIGTD